MTKEDLQIQIIEASAQAMREASTVILILATAGEGDKELKTLATKLMNLSVNLQIYTLGDPK